MTDGYRAVEIILEWRTNPNYKPNFQDCKLVIRELSGFIDILSLYGLKVNSYFTEFRNDCGIIKTKEKFEEMLKQCLS